jgi:hypothetical protein
MREALIAIVILGCLVAASLGSLFFHGKLPPDHREEDTHHVVRSLTNIFVIMTSLVLGLMVNSAKNTFESVDRNVHALATNLIMLDRTLVHYGAEANETRKRLLAFAQHAARSAQNDDLLAADRVSEQMLNDTGKSLNAIKPLDAGQVALWQHAQQQFQKVVELRWIIVEQSDGTIPMPLLVLLAAWLMAIFASFGYRAPRNAVVISSFMLASLLVASAVYLILDLDVPFSGPIKVSPAPLERAVVEMHVNA